MKEYLQTTSLGDLVRKAKDLKISAEAKEGTVVPNTDGGEITSSIRNSVGEINQ